MFQELRPRHRWREGQHLTYRNHYNQSYFTAALWMGKASSKEATPATLQLGEFAQPHFDISVFYTLIQGGSFIGRSALIFKR